MARFLEGGRYQPLRPHHKPVLYDLQAAQNLFTPAVPPGRSSRKVDMVGVAEVKYKADITAGALKVPESRVVAGLLLQGLDAKG